MSLTYIKDLNLKIMMELEDEDLLKICNTDQNARNNLCKNEDFWRNRFMKKYTKKDFLYKSTFKPKRLSWKDYYLLEIVYNELKFIYPEQILSRFIWSPKGKSESFYVDIFNNKVPFINTPLILKKFLYSFPLGEYFDNKTGYEILTEKAKSTNSVVNGKDLFLDYRLSHFKYPTFKP